MPRALAHQRRVTFEGYRRDDGLWDIEGHLLDSKPMPFEVPGEKAWAPHEPIHNMSIRLTIDDQLVIQEIHVAMHDVPHGECPQAAPPMQKMVGAKLGAGWRKAIEAHLGNAKGCAHLRELLFNMATAAFQTVTSTFQVTDPNQPPPQLGRCVAWNFDTALVSRRYPMFFQWDRKAKT